MSDHEKKVHKDHPAKPAKGPVVFEPLDNPTQDDDSGGHGGTEPPVITPPTGG